MIRMDLGMYGTYNSKPDSFYGFQNTFHLLTAADDNVRIIEPSELTNHHNYSQSAIVPYTSSSDGFLNPESVSTSETFSQIYYPSPSSVMPDESTSIISSENGLSYTNLDCMNYSNSQHHQPDMLNHSDSFHPIYNTTENFSPKDTQQSSSKVHQQTITIQLPLNTKPDYESLYHSQSSQSYNFDSEYQISSSNNSNFDYHLSQEKTLRFSTQVSTVLKENECSVQLAGHGKDKNSDLKIFCTTQHTLNENHNEVFYQYPNRTQDRFFCRPQQQSTHVPTYKWMQVKRNITKSIGMYVVFCYCW
ncbi:uncharacterized protein LOC123271984 [Cotesia glomerata]|nr:uncharacterized protein LOC123271984 [Cotesia glomerata]